jgi:hypothetical protein
LRPFIDVLTIKNGPDLILRKFAKSTMLEYKERLNAKNTLGILACYDLRIQD